MASDFCVYSIYMKKSVWVKRLSCYSQIPPHPISGLMNPVLKAKSLCHSQPYTFNKMVCQTPFSHQVNKQHAAGLDSRHCLYWSSRRLSLVVHRVKD